MTELPVLPGTDPGTDDDRREASSHDEKEKLRKKAGQHGGLLPFGLRDLAIRTGPLDGESQPLGLGPRRMTGRTEGKEGNDPATK